MVKLEDYESVREAAKRLDVSPSLVARWCRQKKLPCERVGYYWLIQRDAEPLVERRTLKRQIEKEQ